MLRLLAVLFLATIVGDFAMARDGNFSPLRSVGADPSWDEVQRQWEKEYDEVMDRAEASDINAERDLDALREKYETHFAFKKIPKLKLPSQGSDD